MQTPTDDCCSVDRHRNATRRTLLGTLGAGTVLALAGCVGDSDSPEDEPVDAETGTTDDLDSPTEFPDEQACAVCGMITPEYPEWNAQLVTTDGTRTYFCSAGCLLAYTVDPERFGGDDEPIENVWVSDYETGELIDGTDCYYVRVTETDHVDDIMMRNPTPFETRERAEAFIQELNDEHDVSYRTETDIISFEAFDMDLAVLYRSNFFEEDGDDADGSHDGGGHDDGGSHDNGGHDEGGHDNEDHE